MNCNVKKQEENYNYSDKIFKNGKRNYKLPELNFYL